MEWLVRCLLPFLPFIYIWPILQGGSWYEADDLLHYPLTAHYFLNSFLAGNWYPRWLPEMNAGYGAPLFNAYQPGYFFLTLPMLLAGLPILFVLYAALWIILFVMVTGSYALARRYCGPAGALVLSMVYFYNTYIMMDIFQRAIFSELMAMALFNWMLFLLLRLSDACAEGRPCARPMLALAACLSGIILSHPVVGVFALCTLAYCAACIAIDKGHGRLFIRWCILAAGFALTLTIPYWIGYIQTVPLMRPHVGSEGIYEPAAHLTQFGLLVLFLLPQVVVAAAGFYYAPASWLNRVTLAACLCAFLLMSEWARPVWQALPILGMMQFPWRIFTALCSLLFLLGAQFGASKQKIGARNYAQALCVIAAFLYFGVLQKEVKTADYAALEEKSKTFAATLTQIETYAFRKEELPARLRGMALMEAASEGVLLRSLAPEREPHHALYEITVTQAGAAAIMRQMYLPGWRLRANGSDIPPLGRPAIMPPSEPAIGWQVTDKGIIELRFNRPGTYRVEGWYEGPPGWQRRNIAVALLLAFLAAMTFGLSRAVASGRMKA